MHLVQLDILSRVRSAQVQPGFRGFSLSASCAYTLICLKYWTNFSSPRSPGE